MKLPLRRAGFILAVIAVNIALDQVTKYIAKSELGPNEVVHVLGNFFILVRAENDGAFLSLFSGLGPVLKIIFLLVMPSLAMVGVLAYSLIKPGVSTVTLFGLSCIVAGGLSNLYDRIVNNMFVFDFMNMGIGPLRTGIFNVADLSIMIGIGVLLLADQIERLLHRKTQSGL